jgi:Cu(I)/Ag(I) efflux system membrane fusion protein
MYAEASVLAEVPDVSTVPRTAILHHGESTYTYVEVGSGAYAMRPVKLGRQGDGLYELLGGLDEGDRVVTSGNVLIDAQAQFIQPTAHDPGQIDEIARLANFEMQGHVSEMTMEAKNTLAATQTSATMAGADPMTKVQQEVLHDFLNIANDVSAALASDNLKDLHQAVPRLNEITTPLTAAFGMSHPWHVAIQGIAAAAMGSEWQDLESARTAFLPFSTRVVEFVQLIKAERSDFRSLKVYHCPMAPKPGLWFQAQGPLRNPFYGAKMLTCGEEVRGAGQASAVAMNPEPPAPKPASAVQPIDSPKAILTANTRHPEAKERMIRTFALGIEEQHRLAKKLSTGFKASSELAMGAPNSANHEAMAMVNAGSAMPTAIEGQNQSNSVSRATIR